MAEPKSKTAAAPQPETQKYVIWLGARSSPITTEQEVRTAFACLHPYELHSKNFNDGGYCLIKVRDIRQAWMVYEFAKMHGFNVGKERGPTIDRSGTVRTQLQQMDVRAEVNKLPKPKFVCQQAQLDPHGDGSMPSEGAPQCKAPPPPPPPEQEVLQPGAHEYAAPGPLQERLKLERASSQPRREYGLVDAAGGNTTEQAQAPKKRKKDKKEKKEKNKSAEKPEERKENKTEEAPAEEKKEETARSSGAPPDPAEDGHADGAPPDPPAPPQAHPEPKNHDLKSQELHQTLSDFL